MNKYDLFINTLRRYHPQFVKTLESYGMTSYQITLYTKYSVLPLTWRNCAKQTLLKFDLDTPPQSSAE